GAVAETALEKALQQLAALAGENMSSRINALEMDNPWSGGGAPGDGSVPVAGPGGGGGDGAAAPPLNGTSAGGASNGSIVGGGALKRSRTCSQSYQWLKSLRDPDPMVSIGSPASSSPMGTTTNSPESRKPNPNAETAAGGARTHGGSTVDSDVNNRNGTNGGVRDAQGSGYGNGGGGGVGFDVVTPERALPVIKRQRVAWPERDNDGSPADDGGGLRGTAGAAAPAAAPAYSADRVSSSEASAAPAGATAVTTDGEPYGCEGGNGGNNSTTTTVTGGSIS
ncbi:unnamed protein product, partial [Scytosiphon promiscuus]